jgi:hypothetical protein
VCVCHCKVIICVARVRVCVSTLERALESVYVSVCVPFPFFPFVHLSGKLDIA